MKTSKTVTPLITKLLVKEIEVVSNTRKGFNEDEIQELAESVKEKGLLQPVGVNKIKDKYFLIFGERRLRAHVIAKLTTIDVKVYEDLTPEQVLELQITENLHRSDIHPMEEARAFNQLILNGKKISYKEIALRVGKSHSFVLNRIKLNDLCAEFQAAFSNDLMTIQTALKLAKLEITDQQDLFERKFSDLEEGELIELNKWELDKYKYDLEDAPFNIKDKKLIAGCGACTSCPFNTAVNTLLFPEESSEAQCTKRSCYQSKVDAHFAKELESILADKNLALFVEDEENMEELEIKFAEHKDRLHSCLNWTTTSILPVPELSEYEESLEEENYDSKEEMMEAYNEAVQEYQDDLKEHEEGVACGMIKRACVVDGDDLGQMIWIKVKEIQTKEIRVNSKDVQERLKTGDATQSDIVQEENRLKNAEVRKKELDEEKTQPLIYDALNTSDRFLDNKEELKSIELAGLIILLRERYAYKLRPYMEIIFGKEEPTYLELCSKSIQDLNSLYAQLSRITFLVEVKPFKGARPSAHELQQALLTIANEYEYSQVETIWNAQLTERNKRETRLSEKLLALQAKKIGVAA